MRRIEIRDVAAERIVREVHGDDTGNETGGYLLGTARRLRVSIEHATGPGPNALRAPTRFSPDPAHGVQELERIRGRRKSLRVLGEWHSHGVNGLSGGDERTLASACAVTPGYLALVMDNRTARAPRAYTCDSGVIQEMELQTVPSHTARDVLARRRAAFFGLGSASWIPVYLAHMGLRHFTLCDDDRLEERNLHRHVGKVHHVGWYKTDAVAQEIRLVAPDACVNVIKRRIESVADPEFRDVIRRHNLIVASSGSPNANRLINRLCVEERKPAVYGGVFAEAAGGFALISDRRQKGSPCFNCLYDVTRGSPPDTNSALEDAQARYGFTTEELEAQLGTVLDVGFVALVQAKLALWQLLRRTSHSLGHSPGNLAIINNRRMEIRWARLRARCDCSVCGEAKAPLAS